MGEVLSGRVAVVTGGGRGIGGAIVRRFAAEGAQVVSLDLEPPPYGELDGVRSLVGDATDERDLARLFAAADELGRLDVVVANVGGGSPVGDEGVGGVERTTREQWDSGIGRNLTATYQAARHALPRLRASGGSVIAISSVQGMRGFPDNAAYNAAKAGLLGLVRQMATDYGPHGVRVNAICPGSILSDGLQRGLARAPDPEARKAKLAGWNPLGRLGTPEEVASAALWLASDESSFVTGHALVVDGGLTTVAGDAR
jgi:NAD(P)-dependent dehydrogenase (short-subunit alcohol dehydrogenase family)